MRHIAVGSASGWRVRISLALLLGGLMELLVAMPLAAQMKSEPAAVLIGVVRTTAGAPVAGASVTVIAAGNHQERHTAVTGADGHLSLAALPPGQYEVTVQLPGRPPTAPSPVNLTDATMVFTVSEQNTLTVTAEPRAPAPVVPNANPSAATDATGAVGGEKLSSQSVSELPLNGRDFSTLLLLAAGTMTDVNGATNFTQQFAINGQRGVEAVFAMDGWSK